MKRRTRVFLLVLILVATFVYDFKNIKLFGKYSFTQPSKFHQKSRVQNPRLTNILYESSETDWDPTKDLKKYVEKRKIVHKSSVEIDRIDDSYTQTGNKFTEKDNYKNDDYGNYLFTDSQYQIDVKNRDSGFNQSSGFPRESRIISDGNENFANSPSYYESYWMQQEHPELFNQVLRNTDFNKNCKIGLGNPRQLAFIPLLSFPGSGNTWLRFLIERATGYATTTAETGDWTLASQFTGEYDYPLSGKSIAMKTHSFGWINYYYPDVNDWEEAQYCIFLIRNPLDAFLAEFQRIHTQSNHTGKIPKEVFFDEYNFKFSRFAWKNVMQPNTSYSTSYGNAAKDSCKKGVHVVHYENLKAGQTSLENELSDLVKFLQSSNPEVQIPFRPHCLKQHNSGAFKRNGDKFTHAEISSLMSSTKIKKFNKRLFHLNYTVHGQVPNNYYIRN